MNEILGEDYELMVGLEIHVALDTKTKMFCGCSPEFGAPANTAVCPVCLGLPGALPVLNRSAVKLGIICALALECEVKSWMQFARKNYHYPDLPKGYQISQYKTPLAEGGQMVFSRADGEDRTVRIRRVHLEEDAGKMRHSREGFSTVDFNRCGVPLAEIVTEPDLKSAGDARIFLEELRELLRYVGVSQVRMEEGELRCDININVLHRPGGEGEVSERTEITELKNLNSFRGVQRAVEYEAHRHVHALKNGKTLAHETRHWDDYRGVTVSSRAKEEVHDYRYFPDPDLPTVTLDEKWVSRLAEEMPETPRDMRQRFVEDYELSPYDARVLVAERTLGEFFEELVRCGGDPKTVANWLMGEVQGFLNAEDLTLAEIEATPMQLVTLLGMVEKNEISDRIAKEVWPEMARTGRDPGEIVKERGLQQISDEDKMDRLAREVIADNGQAVRDYLAGKEKALGFLVGQIMQKSRGKANPQMANQKLRGLLAEQKDSEEE